MRTGRHMVVRQKLVSALRGNLAKPSRREHGLQVAGESGCVMFFREQAVRVAAHRLFGVLRTARCASRLSAALTVST